MNASHIGYQSQVTWGLVPWAAPQKLWHHRCVKVFPEKCWWPGFIIEASLREKVGEVPTGLFEIWGGLRWALRCMLIRSDNPGSNLQSLLWALSWERLGDEQFCLFPLHWALEDSRNDCSPPVKNCSWFAIVLGDSETQAPYYFRAKCLGHLPLRWKP